MTDLKFHAKKKELKVQQPKKLHLVFLKKKKNRDDFAADPRERERVRV